MGTQSHSNHFITIKIPPRGGRGHVMTLLHLPPTRVGRLVSGSDPAASGVYFQFILAAFTSSTSGERLVSHPAACRKHFWWMCCIHRRYYHLEIMFEGETLASAESDALWVAGSLNKELKWNRSLNPWVRKPRLRRRCRWKHFRFEI